MINAIKKYMSDEQKRIRLIKRDPYNIANIECSTRDEQMLAIQYNYKVLAVIQFPDNLALYEAVRINPAAFKYIPDPNPELQRFGCDIHPRAIKYINNLNEEAALVALKKMGNLIGLIDNPTLQMQVAAVANQGESIKNIKNPYEAVQIMAVQKSWSNINHIQNPSIETIIDAISYYEKDMAGRRNIEEWKTRYFIDYSRFKLTEDEWWKIVKAHPAQYELMPLTPEQVAFAQICS